jgi:hypothetical protein
MSLTKEAVLAMANGPEMDALVAERVMRWKLKDYGDHGEWLDSVGEQTDWYDQGGTGDYYECHMHCQVWSPSTDISAALEVVEKLKERYRRVVLSWLANEWLVRPGWETGDDDNSCAFSPELPLAICRAALLSTL